MLEVKNLTKSFGSYTAVDDISFSIKEGEILGLIGQNGAGKTTTFRLILDFLTKDDGTVLWNGKPLSEKEYNVIGYLPEERGLYQKETIEQQLLYFGQLRGKSKEEISAKIDDWMEKFEVKGKKTDKVKTLSKGNQQKVQLIATLIHEPKLVILDEPFSGLDPVNADLLKEAILELKKQGASVIFSSHNMENIEKMVDKLLMLRNGEVVLDGTVQEIRERFERTSLFLEGITSEQLTTIQQVNGVQEVLLQKNGSIQLKLSNEEVGKEIFDLTCKEGYLPMFNQQPPTLEEIFKTKVGEADEK